MNRVYELDVNSRYTALAPVLHRLLAPLRARVYTLLLAADPSSAASSVQVEEERIHISSRGRISKHASVLEPSRDPLIGSYLACWPEQDTEPTELDIFKRRVLLSRVVLGMHT